MIETSGSVRVDLLGGTLDIPPLHLILPNVVTLNMATSLKAVVRIKEIEQNKIVINSLDYDSIVEYMPEDMIDENFQGEFFGPLKFVTFLIHHFNLKGGYEFELSSGSPPGAGLGGSSTMTGTLFKALCELTGKSFDKEHAIKVARGYESIILNKGPAGYQDYYPAMYGGILALLPNVEGVQVEQLYNEDIKETIEDHTTLIYSGELRNSGINNWEVYKGFFDGKKHITEGLLEIASLASKAYLSIKNQQYQELLTLIGQEGATRKKLFPGIVSPSMDSLYNELKEELPDIQMKVCGAGGGGCFLLIHGKSDKGTVQNAVSKRPSMKILDYHIEPPL